MKHDPPRIVWAGAVWSDARTLAELDRLRDEAAPLALIVFIPEEHGRARRDADDPDDHGAPR